VRRTKIVCTVGPATDSVDRLRQIIEAGADVLRLNFSHGTDAEHQATARRIRAVADELGKPVAILQDLPGPKIRLGRFSTERVQLVAGERFTLTTADGVGDQHQVSVNYAKFADEVQPGQTLLLADGTVELEIAEVAPPQVHCHVIVGGTLSSHKGVTVPRGAISLPAFTEDDRTHLRAGLEVGVDLVALSFVRSAKDIADARTYLTGQRADVPLMAKIEKLEALAVLDEILTRADAIMVARGDLGVELPPAEIPFIQKTLIAQSLVAARPVVTATQMLRSMVDSPHPTRAEATDVANAVLDGSDAVMLSEESAIGAYPVEAVQMLSQIAEAADQRLVAQRAAAILTSQEALSPSAAMAHAACLLAHEAHAAAIICCTRNGHTVRLVSRHRPAQPIIAVCPTAVVARRLMLTWGVMPVVTTASDSIDAMVHAALQAAREVGCVAAGDRVVVVGSAPSAAPDQTDFLRFVVMEAATRSAE
jgi:pyruvate kinase